MADDASLIVTVKAETEDVKTKIAALKAQLDNFANQTKNATAKVEKSVKSMSTNMMSMSSAIKGITSSLGAFGISAGTLMTIGKGMLDAWFKVDESTKRAADSAREHRQEVEKTISSNNTLVDKLKELDNLSKDNYLNADGIETANTLVKELTKSYGDLGVTIDKATGKITGMADAIKAIQDKDTERRKSAIQSQIATLQRYLVDANAKVDEYNQNTFLGQLGQNVRMMSKDFSGYMGNTLTGNFDRYNAEQQGAAIKERDSIKRELTNLTNELKKINDNATLDQIAKELEKARQNAADQQYLKGMQANTNVGKLQALGEQYDKTMEIYSRQITSAQEQGDFLRVESLKQQREDYRKNHKIQRDALKEHGTGSTYDANVATRQDAYIKALQSGDRSVINQAKKEYEAAEQQRLRAVATTSGEDVRKAQEAYDARLKDYNDSKNMPDERRADLWKLVQDAERELMGKRQTYEQATLAAYRPPQEAPLQGGAAGTFNAFGIQSIMQKNLDQEQLNELKNISSLIQTAIDNGNAIFY